MTNRSKQEGFLSDPLEALRLILPSEAFSEEELSELVPLCEIQSYESGSVLISEGEASDSRVYFLLAGSVSVFIQDRFILNLKNPGESIGEMGLISSAPRSATVKTDQKSTLLVFHASMDPDRIQGDDYRLRYYLSRIFNTILTEKLRKTSNRAKLYEDMVFRTRGLEQERKGLEEEISQYLEKISLYTHLVNSARDTILITDTRGRILNANASLKEDFGIETEKVVGMELTQLIGDEAGGIGGWEQISNAAKSEKWNRELSLLNPAAGSIPVDCSISAVIDAEGNMLAFSVILRNIEDRKRLEAETRRQQSELQAAYLKIQEMDHVKSNFLNLVSHELRTPISSILAYSEMLTTEGMVDPEDRENFIGVIHQEAGKLTDMVKKVLAIAKMESGEMYFDFTENQLEEVVRYTAVMLRDQAREKGIELTFTAQSSLPPMVFDEENLAEAITQIIDNAVKYTEQGIISVEVSRIGEEALIRVEDTGIGFKGTDIGDMMENFGRGDKINVGGHGLGLGLPLCYLVVKAHSGEMRMESEPDVGTKVSITLPWRRAKNQQRA